MKKTLLCSTLIATISGCLGRDSSPDSADPIAELALSCHDPCDVLVDATAVWNFKPHAGTSPIDPDFRVIAVSVFEDLPDPFAYARRWTFVDITQDGGSSWNRVRLPGGLAAGPTHPLGSCTSMFDPLVEFMPDGTLVVAGIVEGEALTPTNPSVSDLDGARPSWKDFVMAKPSDRGQSWNFEFPLMEENRASAAYQAPINEGDPQCAQVCVRSGYTSADKPFLEISDRGEMAIYVHPGPQIWVHDDGWTLAPILDAGCGEYSVELEFYQGTLYAAFTCFGSSLFAEGTWVARLDDDWNVTSLDPFGTAYPAIASGPSVLWVVYPRASGSNNGGFQDVVLRHSTDGVTWSAPVVVDEGEEAGYTVPTVAVGGQGIAYTGFYHHLPDDGRGEDAYYAVAVARGNQSTSLRVSEVPINYQSLGLQLGHYMGLAPTPDGAMAVWVSGAPGDSRVRAATVAAR